MHACAVLAIAKTWSIVATDIQVRYMRSVHLRSRSRARELQVRIHVDRVESDRREPDNLRMMADQQLYLMN